MIDISLLGCGGMLPLPKRFLTSLLLRHDGHNVLIDCGESTQVAIHLSGFSSKNIDHILITHFHGDHVCGLPGLLMTIANNHRTEPLHIWGGTGLTRIVQGLMVVCTQLPFEVVIHELSFKEASEFTTGALHWQTQPVKHRVPCLAYSAYLPRIGRFDAAKAQALGIPVKYWSYLQKGQTIDYDGQYFTPDDVLGQARRGLRVSYATDCRPSQALIELVRDSDLFIAEGLYGDESKREDAASKGHMIFSEAAEMAKAAQVKELWLTHFSPAMLKPWEHLDDVRQIFANTHLGGNNKQCSLRFSEE